MNLLIQFASYAGLAYRHGCLLTALLDESNFALDLSGQFDAGNVEFGLQDSVLSASISDTESPTMAHQHDRQCALHPIPAHAMGYRARRLEHHLQHLPLGPSAFDCLRYHAVRQIDRVLSNQVQQIHGDYQQQTFRVVGLKLTKGQILQA